MNRNLLVGSLAVLELLPPSARITTETSTAFDLVDYDGNLALYVSTEAPTGTGTPTLTVTLTESETSGGSYTAVSGVTSGALTAAGVAKVIVNTDKRKRFIKAVATISGTNPSFACHVIAIASPRG